MSESILIILPNESSGTMLMKRFEGATALSENNPMRSLEYWHVAQRPQSKRVSVLGGVSRRIFFRSVAVHANCEHSSST